MFLNSQKYNITEIKQIPIHISHPCTATPSITANSPWQEVNYNYKIIHYNCYKILPNQNSILTPTDLVTPTPTITTTIKVNVGDRLINQKLQKIQNKTILTQLTISQQNKPYK